MTAQMYVGTCSKCERPNILVGPLHGEKGGPPFCVRCGCDWNAKHSRKRKLGRIVIKAMKAYMKEGGGWMDLDRLRLTAMGGDFFSDESDTIGADVGDITLELLEATIRLTHPDKHPPERQETATQVTKKLNALKPYVFPEPKPDPKPEVSNTSSKCARVTKTKPSQPSYPCELCINTVPYYYCTTCKAKWEEIHRKERERRNAKQRNYYARLKVIRQWRTPPTVCLSCGEEFRGKRKDAKYCSAKCRQKAHREKRVTDKTKSHVATLNNRNDATVHADTATV